MNMAGYDVVTLGNHDFDLGVDACTKAMNGRRISRSSPRT